MASQANDKRIRLETNLPNSLPSAAFDHHRVVQVLCNLLGNAIKFSPNDSAIVLSARTEEDQVLLLQDTNPISLKMRSRAGCLKIGYGVSLALAALNEIGAQ